MCKFVYIYIYILYIYIYIYMYIYMYIYIYMYLFVEKTRIIQAARVECWAWIIPLLCQD